MNAECPRIADQLRRAFAGKAWHGSPLSELLEGVTSGQAAQRPLPSGHTIWELVLHIDVYVKIALEATEGLPMPKLYVSAADWFVVKDESAAAWADATELMFSRGELLARAIERFGDERLQDVVPGREYDFYRLFHGIVQHSLYHGGQIAMLKKEAAKIPKQY